MNSKSKNLEYPLVSVIIPVYNTEEYLEECLDCIINQSLKNIEIICINDKSTDNSLEILKKYAKKDNRITLIQNKKNLGISVSRNKGLDIIKGEYVSFIDSDDIIDLDCFEKLYEFAKKYSQDFIIFDTLRLNAKGKTYRGKLQETSMKNKIVPNTNLLKNPEIIYDTIACSKFIKTDYLQEKNIRFMNGKYYEDILFTTNLLTNSDNIGINIDAKYYWRIRDGENKSITQNRTDIKNISDRIYITKEVIKIFESSKKYNSLIGELHKKLVGIDFLLYINQIDKGNEEYMEIIKTEINPLLKTFQKEAFDDLNDCDKIKYSLLINKNMEELKYIVSHEKTVKKLKTENQKLKTENETIKTIKGWSKQKVKSILKRN